MVGSRRVCVCVCVCVGGEGGAGCGVVTRKASLTPRGAPGRRGCPEEFSGTGRRACACLPALWPITGRHPPEMGPDRGGCDCQRLKAVPGEGLS